MNRRTFLTTIAATSVMSMLPFPVRAAINQPPALSIPPLLKPDASGALSLTIQQGTSRWFSSGTTTWGYNGNLLGPALRFQRGQTVNVTVHNNLAEDTALHWHGLLVPGEMDGGPQEAVDSGGVWNPQLTIDQPASTCWYHPHPHGKTGRQVAMGLGGLILIDDESQSLPLPSTWGVDDIPVVLQDKRFTPTGQIDYALDVVSAAVGWFGDVMLTNGSVECPVHKPPQGWVRLRLLNGCNARTLRLATSDSRPLYVIGSDGGLLSNPVDIAELLIFPGERFEVLIDMRDGKPLSLNSLPVRQMGMTLSPFNKSFPVLKLNPTTDKGSGTLPDHLAAIPSIPDISALPVRKLNLSMDMRLDHQGMQELVRRHGKEALAGMDDHMGMGSNMGGQGQGMANDQHQRPQGHMQGGRDSGMGHNMESEMGHGMGRSMGGGNHTMANSGKLDIRHANFINGKVFDMNNPLFDCKQNRYERWVISGVGDMMLHPFHIHGTQFRILSENNRPVEEHRKGFKDVVFVEGGISEVLVKFPHLAPRDHMYMAHCHLLEHEDTGMMAGFTVSK